MKKVTIWKHNNESMSQWEVKKQKVGRREGGGGNFPLPPPSFLFAFSKTVFSREDVNPWSLFFFLLFWKFHWNSLSGSEDMKTFFV